MIVTCAWCGKQVIDAHDCPERRAAMIETQQREILAINKEAAANPPSTNEDVS